ncbi:MAG TPA: caspase family protein [Methyloceanibacter sp.]|nr:caspase family protein [Methyloceanibacter sp.]
MLHAEPPESAAVPQLPLGTVPPQTITPPTRIAVVTPETEPTAEPAEPRDVKAETTARVQRCFAKLGYYKGPIDGKANADTWTAHWYFKNEYGLKSHGDFLDKPVLKKIDQLCKETKLKPEPEPEARKTEPKPDPKTEPKPSEAAASDDTAAAEKNADGETLTAALADGEEDLEPVVEEEPPLPPTRLEIDCLPKDLIDVLRRAHGDDVRAKACAAGCLPSPKGLSQAQLDDLQSRYGVVWCRSCVQIEGHLSLDDIRRIEDEGNLELCSMPPRQIPRPGVGNGNVVKSFSRIRELYRALPPAPEDPGAIAVIVGNNAYDNLPTAETARSDAGAMYFFLTEHLGFRQDRIIDLRNGRRADFERVFGPVPGSDGELARLVRAQPDAKVVVYYSGHGATNSSHSDTYMLPVDAEPYREERSGYPLSTLYDNLAALKAKSVLVLLESSYGRDHGPYVLPPNLPETTRSALPSKPREGVTVLAAADRGQRALIDTSYDIGLFTRYAIEGLAGSADLYPVGNGDGSVDSAEIYAYTAAMVRLAARKTFGLLQQPVYSSVATPILSSSGAVAAKPVE